MERLELFDNSVFCIFFICMYLIKIKYQPAYQLVTILVSTGRKLPGPTAGNERFHSQWESEQITDI